MIGYMERIIQIIYRLGLIVIWVSSIVIGGMFLIQIPSVGNTTEFFRFLGYGVMTLVIGVVVHVVWRWLLRPESSRTPAVETDIGIVVSSNRGDVLTHKDDMWWMAKTEKVIKGLDRDDPNFADNKWFFAEVFLFYTDRTLHHPNPGLPLSKRRPFELAPFGWKFPKSKTRSYVYPSYILEPDRFEAQKNNPYMHPLLAKYETMKDVGLEKLNSNNQDIGESTRNFVLN